MNDRDYYIKSKETLKPYVGDVVLNRQDKESLMIGISVPIIGKNGSFQGCVVESYNLKSLQKQLASIKDNYDGYVFLFSQSRKDIYHPNPDFIGQQFEDTVPPELKIKFDETILAEKNGQTTYVFNNAERLMSYQTIDSMNWKLGVAIQTKHIKEAIARTRNKSIATTVFYIIIISIIMILISISITKKVKDVSSRIKDISEGEKDLTQRIKVNSKDELGSLAKYFNNFTNKLNSIIYSVQNASKNLENVGMDLSSNTEETASAVYEISTNIQNAQKQIENQSNSVTETSSSIEQMTRAIESLNLSIEKQKSSLSESSASIEEMVSNIHSVTKNSEKAQQYMNELNSASDEGKSKLNNMQGIITEIDKQSKTLLEANNIISSIAGKTNLLAMNAAIEAAHAGESGKGFAVVADEIRKLAEQSTQQSKNVENNLKLILKSISNVVESSQEVDKSFDKVFDVMQFVNNIVNEIKIAMEEQSNGSKQILNSLNSIQEITASVRTGADEMNAGNNQLITTVKSLKQVNQEVNNSIVEINTGTKEISKAIENIKELSFKNKESILLVNDNVGEFVVTKPINRKLLN